MFSPDNPRYRGKPLLRVLECFVLWAIDELPEKESVLLREMTPKLQSIFQKKGSWQEVIAQEMQYPSDLSSQIRILWKENLERASFVSVALDPQISAERFVDENLAGKDIEQSP
jgi:hypothetical protein